MYVFDRSLFSFCHLAQNRITIDRKKKQKRKWHRITSENGYCRRIHNITIFILYLTDRIELTSVICVSIYVAYNSIHTHTHISHKLTFLIGSVYVHTFLDGRKKVDAIFIVFFVFIILFSVFFLLVQNLRCLVCCWIC